MVILLKEETSVGDKVSLVVFTIIFPTEYYVFSGNVIHETEELTRDNV